jgi:hypothetical protein
MLKALALSGVTAALPKLTHARSIFGRKRKPIREFGRVYDYLKDAQLRLKERQKERIVIENAEFNGEEFINVAWGYCDFVNCHFPASHRIRLTQLANCNFIECEFGPTRSDDSINFSDCREVVFWRCKFNMGNVGCTVGDARFEQCECVNPDPDPNHSYVVSGDRATLVNCLATNYGWRATEKLILQGCTMNKGSAELLSGGAKYRPDIELINSTFENAEEILWGAKVKNFTMSRCIAKGAFRAQGLIVEDTALYEHLKEGFFDFSGVGYHGKLRVRNCDFSATGKRAENDVNDEHVFVVNGAGATDTLLEESMCRSDKSANLTGAYSVTTRESFKSKPRNTLYVIRNCKIPYVQLNWVRSKHLRLENCEIGQLEIRDGQIGKLEIVNTKFDRLDLSRTVAAEYALDASGEVVDTGSNYDKATGKAGRKR